MPKPRYSQVSLDVTPYYHCVSRCVRRAFLCGTDSVSKRCYEHRRQWIQDKLHELTHVFALELCAYAVMSNHYHVVLYVDKTQAESWSVDDVITRWHQLFSGHVLSQRYLQGDTLCKVELCALDELAAQWRGRLMDVSWFMRILNETIARGANAEDDCTGRFWEGRFKSQALLDDVALAACLAYVDLNPLRAGLAESPETSMHTSIQQRSKQAKNTTEPNHILKQPCSLFPFAGNPRKDMPRGLPFRLTDYLALVDWTGRLLRENKKGVIDAVPPPIIKHLNIEPRYWLYLSCNFESLFKSLVGAAHKLKCACQVLGYQRTPGITNCETYFP